MKLPETIVHQMMNADAFSQWLGIEVVSIGLGVSKLSMVVREEMTNGFGIAHGGITYSLADSALAFASNSRGNHAVSIETSISHIQPVFVHDVLIAQAQELSRSSKIGVYQITIENQNKIIVAHFKGTVFIKNTLHE